MAGTATKLHVLDCGSMSCDLTWLLLKTGRSIRPRAERDKPVEERWVPTGLHEFFPYDRVTEEQYLDRPGRRPRRPRSSTIRASGTPRSRSSAASPSRPTPT
jgi:hypothetical protein